MASVVEICNLALSRLGDKANVASIDPPEGSAQAEHCATFYPLARDTLLEIHPWNFARKRVALALLANHQPPWRFAYARPNDCIRAISILSQDTLDEESTETYCSASDENNVPIILSNTQNAVLLYISRIEDAATYPPLFVDSLAWLLASHLAGAVIKGDAGANMAKSCYQNFMMMLSQAKFSDTSQRNSYALHTPSWIAER